MRAVKKLTVNVLFADHCGQNLLIVFSLKERVGRAIKNDTS